MAKIDYNKVVKKLFDMLENAPEGTDGVYCGFQLKDGTFYRLDLTKVKQENFKQELGLEKEPVN